MGPLTSICSRSLQTTMKKQTAGQTILINNILRRHYSLADRIDNSSYFSFTCTAGAIIGAMFGATTPAISFYQKDRPVYSILLSSCLAPPCALTGGAAGFFAGPFVPAVTIYYIARTVFEGEKKEEPLSNY